MSGNNFGLHEINGHTLLWKWIIIHAFVVDNISNGVKAKFLNNKRFQLVGIQCNTAAMLKAKFVSSSQPSLGFHASRFFITLLIDRFNWARFESVDKNLKSVRIVKRKCAEIITNLQTVYMISPEIYSINIIENSIFLFVTTSRTHVQSKWVVLLLRNYWYILKKLLHAKSWIIFCVFFGFCFKWKVNYKKWTTIKFNAGGTHTSKKSSKYN